MSTFTGNVACMVALQTIMLHFRFTVGRCISSLGLAPFHEDNNELSGNVSKELTKFLESLDICHLDGNTELFGIPANCL